MTKKKPQAVTYVVPPEADDDPPLVNFVVWLRVDRSGRERALQAYVPPGVLILLGCPEGDKDEEGMDAIARMTARNARLKVRKRLFRPAADLEVYDGREGNPPEPPPEPEGEDHVTQE